MKHDIAACDEVHRILSTLREAWSRPQPGRSRQGWSWLDTPVTHLEATSLLEQYRAGLDAELMLLHGLQAIAVDQRRATESGSATEMREAIDHRVRVLATLATVEHGYRNVRQQLFRLRYYLADMPGFQEIVALHRRAANLVAHIVTVDADSVEALENAEQARHEAAQALEQGESTLAAYRRAAPPALEPATPVNRKG